MESRLSLGTVVGVFLAIAFGVYCLYASATAHHRRDELHGGLTHRSRFVDAVNHTNPYDGSEFLIRGMEISGPHTSIRLMRGRQIWYCKMLTAIH
jgi:hypothetical protein